MRTLLLALGLLQALIATSNGASEECLAMGLYACDVCVDPDLTCYGCASGSVVYTDGSSCADCSVRCDECEIVSGTMSETTCVECEAGSYAEVNGGITTCTECGTNCQNCTAAGTTTTCEECTDTSYSISQLDSANCVSCGSRCLRCSVDPADDSVTCSSCESGSYVKDGGCTTCPSNCLTCAEDAAGTEICTTCDEGYQTDDTGENCLLCFTGCDTCISGTSTLDSTRAQCSACEDGYYLDTDGCTTCDVSDCDTCSSSGNCDTCNSGYLLEDTGNTCTECDFECAECSYDGNGDLQCDVCNDAYGIKESQDEVSCDPCPSNCDICTTTGAILGQCSDCAQYYYVDSDNECSGCPDNCMECTDDTTCMASQCETGYILEDGLCYACTSDCDTCVYNDTVTGSTICTACDAYFGLNEDGSACESCGAGCQICEFNTTGMYRCQCDTAGNLGDTSVDWRGDCSGTFACDAGYLYDDSGVETCTACTTFASGCTSCNDTSCLTCDVVEGYALAPESTTSCFACSTVDSACSACETLVGAVHTSGYQCTTCNTGYYVNDEQCDRCGTNCDACTQSGNSGNTRCDTCKGDAVTYINDDDNTANCLACDSNCMDCEYDSDVPGAVCAECVDGYIVNSGGTCDACSENCGQCEEDNTGNVVCTDGECDDNYGNLDDGTCGACPDQCPTCTYDETLAKLICDSCGTGYEENEEFCVPCPSDCTSCTITDGNVRATTARDGYFVETDSLSCTRCVSNCLACTSSACSSCGIGYGLSSTRQACTDCATLTEVANCATCTDASSDGNSTCTSCSSAYTLQDDYSSCMSITSFGTDCVLALDLPPQCTTCDDPERYLNDEDHCVLRCWLCGTRDSDGVFVQPWPSPEECNKADGSNYTSVEECDFRCATAVILDVDDNLIYAARGCDNQACDVFEIEQENGESACTTDFTEQGEFACIQCFGTDYGNIDAYGSATTPVVTMLLLTALLLLPFV